MGQFWAYTNPNPATRDSYPFLLEIQSNLLRDLGTTVVIPLTSSKTTNESRMSRLNPEFEINGESYTGITQEIAGLERRHLGQPAYDLTHYHSEIIAAIDFLISGV